MSKCLWFLPIILISIKGTILLYNEIPQFTIFIVCFIISFFCLARGMEKLNEKN